MPVTQKDIKYGCERCSNPEVKIFVELKQFGQFRHMTNGNTIELFMCSQCQTVYIKMMDEFIDGFFQNESDRFRS